MAIPAGRSCLDTRVQKCDPVIPLPFPAIIPPLQVPQDDKGGKWQADQVVVANVDGGYTSTFDVKEYFDASKAKGSYYRWTSDIAYMVIVYTSKDQVRGSCGLVWGDGILECGG